MPSSSERSVQPEQFGTFLSTIFDEWVRHDVGEVFVQTFEATLRNFVEPGQSGMCVFNETCGLGIALEETSRHNDRAEAAASVLGPNGVGRLIDAYLAAGKVVRDASGKRQVATDPVGSRPGNWVFLASGSAARYAAGDFEILTDLTIAGIIDEWPLKDATGAAS